MESLEWIKINPKVIFRETKKKTYGCLYSTIYFAPGARSIRDSRGIEKSLEHRKSFYKHSRYWGFRHQFEQLDRVNLDQLTKIKEAMDAFSGQVKIRIEEPRVFFYADSEKVLFDLSDFLGDYKKYLIIVHRPVSTQIAEQLGTGAVILKKPNNYTHKIFLKSGEYKNKQSILEYLLNLNDTVKISEAVQRSFESKHNMIWNAWFYTSDPNIELMLNLIEPNCVRNIHSLVVTH